jgi:hypothetical protein
MRASQELTYMITRNHNAFLRKNLTQTFTSDVFSCSNIPRACDLGFLRKNARGFNRNSKGELVASTKRANRAVVKNKNRRGVLRTNFTNVVGDLNKARSHCKLLGLRRQRLLQTARRVKNE